MSPRTRTRLRGSLAGAQRGLEPELRSSGRGHCGTGRDGAVNRERERRFVPCPAAPGQQIPAPCPTPDHGQGVSDGLRVLGVLRLAGAEGCDRCL